MKLDMEGLLLDVMFKDETLVSDTTWLKSHQVLVERSQPTQRWGKSKGNCLLGVGMDVVCLVFDNGFNDISH